MSGALLATAGVAVGLSAYLYMTGSRIALRHGKPSSTSVPAVLYCFPPTTCSRRVLATLAELGAVEGRDFVIESVPTTGPNKSAMHLARQPFGKIPVWGEGDWMLYESAAICEYLCHRFPGQAASNLLPPAGRARAEVHKWLSVEATELRPNILKPYKERVLKPMKGLGTPDEAVVTQACKDMQPALDVLDAQLASSAFLAGDTFTLADLAFLPYLEALCAAKCDHLIAARPHLSEWWARVRARPKWQQVVGMALKYLPKNK